VKYRDIFMTHKLQRLIHQQCIPSTISVHYWDADLWTSTTVRSELASICCSQLCRDNRNTAQCQAVHFLLSNTAVSIFSIGLGFRPRPLPRVFLRSRPWSWDNNTVSGTFLSQWPMNRFFCTILNYYYYYYYYYH